MSPRIRKLLLLIHIASSVGWFGAVVPYLALTIAGLTSHDPQVVRAAYLSMDLIGWFVIVPFSLASLLTGLTQSLLTQWGLFRHWWIVGKFLLTVVSVVILLRHMQGASHMARMAAGTWPADFRFQQIQHLIHPAGGLLVLLATMALSVFKPGGMTPYGRRKASIAHQISQVSNENRPLLDEPIIATKSNWRRFFGIHAAHAIGIALILVIVLHLSNRGMYHH